MLFSYYSKELREAEELFYLYNEKYPQEHRHDYIYAAILYVVTNKKANMERLLSSLDKRSRSLFYKEVERLEDIQRKRTFKKKDASAYSIGVSEGFL